LHVILSITLLLLTETCPLHAITLRLAKFFHFTLFCSVLQSSRHTLKAVISI